MQRRDGPQAVPFCLAEHMKDEEVLSVSHKITQLGSVRHTGGKRFCAQRRIQFGKRGFNVRIHEEHPNTTGKRSQKKPTEERELQNENIELLAICHLAAELQRTLVGHVRIFRHQVIHHAVLVCLIDAGDHKQQAPQENKQIFHKHHFHHVAVSWASERGEQRRERSVAHPALHKIAALADCHRIAYKHGKENANHHCNEHEAKCGGGHSAEIGQYGAVISVLIVVMIRTCGIIKCQCGVYVGRAPASREATKATSSAIQ